MALYSVRDLATYLDADISKLNKSDSEYMISGLATLKNATCEKVGFLINDKYVSLLAQCKAGAVCVTDKYAHLCSSRALIVKDPHVAYAKLSRLFANKTYIKKYSKEFISPKANIGDNVIIGNNCIIYANVTIYDGCTIGNNVIIHSGAVIGADGFGFAFDKINNNWIKIEHLGAVRISDDVEIGANTCIDRGAIEDTIIGKGVKIDNLVQIGHNVQIGEHSVLAGATSVAGSTKIGKYCMIGGRCAIGGHLQIADKVILAGNTSVASSIKNSGTYASTALHDFHAKWRKNIMRFKQLDSLFKRVKKLENNA